MSEERVEERVGLYYAIPSAYTIGPTFDKFEEAMWHVVDECRKGKAANINKGYIDEREVVKHDNGVTDRIFQRWTVEVKKG